jgi:hypothetical protein
MGILRFLAVAGFLATGGVYLGRVFADLLHRWTSLDLSMGLGFWLSVVIPGAVAICAMRIVLGSWRWDQCPRVVTMGSIQDQTNEPCLTNVRHERPSAGMADWENKTQVAIFVIFFFSFVVIERVFSQSWPFLFYTPILYLAFMLVSSALLALVLYKPLGEWSFRYLRSPLKALIQGQRKNSQ